MSWGIKIAAKSQAAAKAKIAEYTQKDGEYHGVPQRVAEQMSAALEKMGEPGAGQAFLVEGSGHDATGPSDYSSKSSFEISRIGLAE